MIPLKDNIPSRRFPIVNISLIVINVLVFLFQNLLQLAGDDQMYFAFMNYGLIPSRIWSGEGFITLLTSMFMHGGWWHLISNMLSLYIFGDNIEDRMGHFGYLGFYMLSGLAASVAHLITNSGSTIPAVGASGAIAGVLGAYLLLYPRAQVLTLVPIYFFARLIPIPAIVYLGFWFVSQIFNGFLSLGAANQALGGVAWWEHIGGFAFGLAIAGILKLISPRPPTPPTTRITTRPTDPYGRYRRPTYRRWPDDRDDRW